MYRKILLLLLILHIKVGMSLAQDIHSLSPVVLPQSPLTSYIISSGEQLKVSSAQSVTLAPGTWFRQGSMVSVRIANSPVIKPAPFNPAANLDMNWTSSKSYDEDGRVISETKVFYDKTGKSIQNQVKNISAGHVLADQTIYDAMGRSAVATMLAPINNAAFSYKANFVTSTTGNVFKFNNFDLSKTNQPDAVGNFEEGSLGWYYSNNNTIDAHVAGTSFPYSRTDYYKDGTAAIKRTAAVGEQLRMGSGHEERSYSVPVVNELDHYLQLRNKFFSSSVVGEMPSSVYSQAIQSISQDANGKEIVVISDKSGRVLMTARPGNDLKVTNMLQVNPGENSIHYFKLFAVSPVNILQGISWSIYDMDADEQKIFIPNTLGKGLYKLSASGVPGDMVALTYENSYTDISYNFYNESGQLLASITPNGVKKILELGIGSYNKLSELPFLNTKEYDLQGRMIASTQTDAGRSEYIYRKDGSMRFSQNSVQRNANPKRFSYVNYDRWGRSVESGEYNSGSISFTTAKTDLVLQENISLDGGLLAGSKLSTMKSYYDLADNTHGLIGYQQDEGFLKGAVSFTENNSAKTWYNYNEKGKVVWVVKKIAGLGIKTINYSFDTKGNVSKVDFQKDNGVERFIHEYEYDADNRLKVVYTSTNNADKKEQARYYYYLHGPLKRVELAANLQGIDYTYTPQGWLKSINHPLSAIDPGKDGNQNGFGEDVFGMTMEYFGGDYSRDNTGINSLATNGYTSYSGNVTAQTWKSLKPQTIINANGVGVNNPAMVTYEYDEKYQFNNNKYGTPNFTSKNFTENLNANREFNLSYDYNGNIKTLNRTNSAGVQTANFNYSYKNNTNQLAGVDNYATYDYNDLGQMTAQSRVNGEGYYVDYNLNGKITHIYSDAAHTKLRVSFGYDEAGLRISKVDHLLNLTTYYVHDFNGITLAIYDNGGGAIQQKQIPIYAANRIGFFNRTNSKYQYELTDHLGNVRVVVNGDKLANGKIDIVSYSDYYPFGSSLTLQGNNDYLHGYQGQFSSVDKETGWNNFNLRMYDAAIGRWMSTDPYGQYFSPYVGMGNNPVEQADPDGGYSIIGALLRYGRAYVQGKNPEGGIYNNGNTWGFHTDGTEGFIAHFKDPTESSIQPHIDRYVAMHSDKRMGHYNESTGKINWYSGRIESNYFFESWFIGGKLFEGAGLAYNSVSKGFAGGWKGTATVLGSDAATLGNASRMIPEEGIHQILVHGAPTHFSVDGVNMTSKELARALLQVGFKKGTPVRLVSCETGVFGDGAAYELSRYLKSAVTAPTHRIRVLEGGAYKIADGGTFKTFFNTTRN